MIALPRGAPRPINGLRILVTGGGKGLGAVLTAALAKEGAKVVVAAREQAALERTAKGLAQRDLEILTVCLDLTCEQSILSAVQQSAKLLGGLDAVVHNAAAPAGGPVEHADWAEMARVFDTAIRGPACLTREALPWLRQSSHPALVFISSLAARDAVAGAGIYGAAKRGVEALAGSLYEELRNEGIRVASIAPSFAAPPAIAEATTQFLPQAALDPWDVADALLYVLRARSTVCPLHVELRLAADPWIGKPELP